MGTTVIEGGRELTQVLGQVRERTRALLAPIPDPDLDRVLDPIMSPIAWDVGHIAAFEDLWFGHREGGLELLRGDLAATYDAAASPRSSRPSLPWLRADEAFDYLDRVRERTLDLIDRGTVPEPLICELVIRHEQQHCETILQTIELARIPWKPDLPVPPPSAPAANATSGLDTVVVPASTFTIGSVDGAFSYDNERPAQSRQVDAFELGVIPITNGDWLDFIDRGGYSMDEAWSADGIAWRERTQARHPGGWEPDGSNRFIEWRAGRFERLDPLLPVVHISFFEADAFARFHDARLPSEAEWELAATWDPATGSARPQPWGERPPDPGLATVDHVHLGTRPPNPAGRSALGLVDMIGNCWEWTADPFLPYEGFRWHPYEEYSTPFFGGSHRVLRGASWATAARCASPRFRNWDLPERRQIFAGMRIARDVR